MFSLLCVLVPSLACRDLALVSRNNFKGEIPSSSFRSLVLVPNFFGLVLVPILGEWFFPSLVLSSLVPLASLSFFGSLVFSFFCSLFLFS